MSLPRDVRILILARGVNRLGAFSLAFLTLLLTREIRTSIVTAGLVMSAFGVASMASRVIGGWLADTVSRRATIVGGLVGCAVAQLAIAASTTVLAAAGSAILLGLAFEIYESPSQALVADTVGPALRPAAFGALGAVLSVAALGAGVVAALLAPVGIRLLFVVDAASCLATAVVVARLLPPHRAASPETTSPTARRWPWHSRPLVLLFAANVVFAACYLQAFVSLPLTLADRGIGASGFAVLLTVSALVACGAQPLLRPSNPTRGWVMPSRTCSVVGGYLLLAAGMCGYAVAAQLAGFIVATVAVGLGEALLMGHSLALVSELAPPDRRGQYLAAYGLSWGVAATVGPVAGTWLLESGGDRTLWLAAAGCCAAVGLAHVPLLRHRGEVPAVRRVAV